MKLFLRLFRYVFPFKFNIFLMVVANLFYSIFSLFSLTMIVPFLSVLFGQTQVMAVKPELSLSIQSFIDIFYYYMGVVISRYGAVYALVYIAVFMIILSFLSNVCRYFGQFWLAPIRAGVLNHLRKDIYYKMLLLPIGFYADKKKGDIMNRIGSDVQEVEWSVISSLQTVCRDPILIVVYLVALFSVNLKLTIISLLILPLSGYLIAIIGKSIKKKSIVAQQILGRLSSLFEEAISGLRIIKSYNAISHASEKFKEENVHFYRINKKIFRINDLGSPLIEFLCIVSLVIILLLGNTIIKVPDGFSNGIFLMYVIVFARVIPPAKSIVTAYYTIQKGLASAVRIYAIIDAEVAIKDVDNPIPIKEFKQAIAYEDVGFSYVTHSTNKKETVLNHVNFSVKKGEVVAIVGHSGAGKSTIVDLLPRFWDATTGRITIDGTPIQQFCIQDIRTIFGLVTQDVILFNDTIFNNLTLGNTNLTKQEVEAAAQIAQAHHFISEMELGYETVIGDRGMRLSGGERQRLSIARAILRNPQVLILDEATSALDTESEFMFQQALKLLLVNRTAIIIAHRLSTIRYADRILFVKNGTVSECGTHNELMLKNGDYYRYYNLQQFDN